MEVIFGVFEISLPAHLEFVHVDVRHPIEVLIVFHDDLGIGQRSRENSSNFDPCFEVMI